MIIVMIINISTYFFHKISFHYFEDYLSTKQSWGQGNNFVGGKHGLHHLNCDLVLKCFLMCC
jgi:hypothetical protein